MAGSWQASFAVSVAAGCLSIGSAPNTCGSWFRAQICVALPFMKHDLYRAAKHGFPEAAAIGNASYQHMQDSGVSKGHRFAALHNSHRRAG
ncbi:MAG: hypothetical protein ACLQDV_05055 [Candidatus Binataceae bacterium]